MRKFTAGLGLATMAFLSACELPTKLPSYGTEWNVPGKSTTISVNTLLPSGVTATNDNSAFQINVAPSSSSITRGLGQDCASCAILNGQTIPKPAFTGGGSANLTLPSNVVGATLVRDTLTVTISNGFNFDPIRPSASAPGYLLITVKNGSALVGRDSIDGRATALAAGSSLTRKIPLSGTITGANGLQISTTLNSPIGDPVLLDASRSITVTGAVGAFFVSSAQVSLVGQSVSAAPSELDLSGVSATIAKHAGGGSLLLTVSNPFNVTGNLSVAFTGGAMPINKTVALSNGASTPSIDFTKDEMLALLGRNIKMGFSGTVGGSNVTVAPGQVVSVSSRLQIVLNVGSN